MKKDISKKKLIKSSIDSVWEAISSEVILSKWFFDANLETHEAGKVSFKKNENKHFSGEILTIQEPINLAYSWNDPNLNHTTYVWWKLQEKNGYTFVELEHSGFKSVKGVIIAFTYGPFWKKALNDLDQYLQKSSVED